MSNFKKNLELLKEKIREDSGLLDRSCDIWKGFGHPSAFFHKEAIREATVGTFLGEEHLKMIYAVLIAWGMHRMGNETDTKLVSFEEFCNNFDAEKKPETLKQLRQYKRDCVTLDKATPNILEDIAKLIVSLKISSSGSQIVSGAKTLHHILPRLVPPIDRAYSIKFMKCDPPFNKKGSPGMNNDEHWYALTFMEKMQSFLTEDKCQNLHIIEDFLKRKHTDEKSVFLTSIPKVLDNLIVKFVQERSK